MFANIKPARLALALVASYFLSIAALFHTPGGWLHDGKQPLMSDYIAIHAAGLLVGDGNPAAAYDWKQITAAHTRTLGREEKSFFPFPYPPPYLAVAQALSLAGYVAGALAFLVLTFAGYLASLRRITGSTEGAILMVASPASLLNIYILQNGFLTGGLFGAALALLAAQPILSGVLIGFLALKPQLGILVPFALAAGGYWRTIGAATATVLALAVASLAAWGTEPWLAFFSHMGLMLEGARNEPAYMAKLQTLYGLLCTLGLPSKLALAAQMALGLASIAAVTLVWRSQAPLELKAAALATGSLLFSPYLFIYDFTVLVVAQGFLLRHATANGWERYEIAGLIGINGLIFAATVLPLPPGILAVLAMAGLVTRRLERCGSLPFSRPAFA